MTYTYALLEVSKATFDEIAAKLAAAGSTHSFDEHGGKNVLDMHGLALVVEDEPTSTPDPTRDALALVLPLAKGYAAIHPQESNLRYCQIATDLLEGKT